MLKSALDKKDNPESLIENIFEIGLI